MLLHKKGTIPFDTIPLIIASLYFIASLCFPSPVQHPCGAACGKQCQQSVKCWSAIIASLSGFVRIVLCRICCAGAARCWDLYLFNKLAPGAYPLSVSYTHLDVYKRQFSGSSGAFPAFCKTADLDPAILEEAMRLYTENEENNRITRMLSLIHI